MLAATVPLLSVTRQEAGRPGVVRPEAHRRVRAVGVVAVVALLVAATLAPSAVTRLAVPLAVAGILVGIPHGAVDHLVPGWLAGRSLPPAALAGLLLGYVAVVAVAAVALRAMPTTSMVIFLAVSAWHFGRAEVVTQAEAAGRPVPATSRDVLPALAHGLVTVLLPLAAHPRVSLPVLGALAPRLAVVSSALLHALVVVVAAAVAAAAVQLVLLRRRGEAAELVLLAVLFARVHPFAAFGVYFGLWHALRHTARLVELAAGKAPLRVGVRRFVAHAAVPTALALTLLVAVWATADLAASRASSLMAAELATLAALTLPHAAVVAFLDAAVSGAAVRPQATGGHEGDTP